MPDEGTQPLGLTLWVGTGNCEHRCSMSILSTRSPELTLAMSLRVSSDCDGAGLADWSVPTGKSCAGKHRLVRAGKQHERASAHGR